MEITINFEEKHIFLNSEMNLLDLIQKLTELNIDFSNYKISGPRLLWNIPTVWTQPEILPLTNITSTNNEINF